MLLHFEGGRGRAGSLHWALALVRTSCTWCISTWHDMMDICTSTGGGEEKAGGEVQGGGAEEGGRIIRFGELAALP